MKKVKPRTAIIIICIAVIFTIFFSISISQPPPISSKPPDRADIYLVAKEFVTQRLKAPSTADFPSSNHAEIINISDNKWQVRSYVDAQNSFGAKLRSNFTALVVYNSKMKTWSLEKIHLE